MKCWVGLRLNVIEATVVQYSLLRRPTVQVQYCLAKIESRVVWVVNEIMNC